MPLSMGKKAKTNRSSQRYPVYGFSEAEMIASAGRTVQVRDPNGRLVGFITPAPREEEIAAARTRLAEGPQGPTFTTEQVLAHLRS
ncbi:MAG TPA: hypothetical protein VFI31_05565 [Pirellulales bacterium]|nr:hypothetical protein [Pirellulales bacterium]